MNKKNQFKLSMALVAFILSVLLAVTHGLLFGALAFTFFACAINSPRARTCAVTLSVPEIMMDVLDAFKLSTPEVFGDNGFATDLSSKTAALGDKITAHISHVPTTGTYDKNNGGFKNATQDVTGLIEDVPVTLNQFRIVTVNIGWLTQLSSKLPLYKEAIRNYGYALGKYVIDQALATVTPVNFSNSVKSALANVNLDVLDTNIRNQMNTQKTYPTGRFMLCSTGFASALGADDRVRSSLFYGALNGDKGYRVWTNIAGFSWIREYPDFPAANNLLAFGADKRAICIAFRRPDFSTVADDLGVPKVMEFHNMTDDETGIPMVGASWQEVGTGDVYVSCGLLFGIGSGNQGGAANALTDAGGVLVQSQ